MDFDVVVVGSINYDISVHAHRLPQPGETVIGDRHFFGPGGKGANQAVAAARLGARVAMIGRVGDDGWGKDLVDGLAEEGVDVSMIGVDDRAPTGIALITIDDRAENTIVVSPGANTTLSPEHLAPHSARIAGARAVLAQLEIPAATVAASAEIAGGVFCLNPAPAGSLPETLLERTDVLVPNRPELAMLAGLGEIDSLEHASEVARSLRPGGATVVTLGADGAIVVTRDGSTPAGPFSVEAVDPTGAGDTFCGALATSLSRGDPLAEAARFAAAAAAISVTQPGAQRGMPTAADVEALLAP